MSIAIVIVVFALVVAGFIFAAKANKASTSSTPSSTDVGGTPNSDKVQAKVDSKESKS